MFKTNSYFDGKVMSLAFQPQEGSATVGVMAPGTYEFGTSTEETMVVISGKLRVLLPGSGQWKDYLPFEKFTVPKGSKFGVEVITDSAYLCYYR